MNTLDISGEIRFQTARSGGSGGQNVNKVETAVLAQFHIESSKLLHESQKKLVAEKLSARINAAGFLFVKSQIHRSQIRNKEEAIRLMNTLVNRSLALKKPRIATKPSRSGKENRLEWKRKRSVIKQFRRRPDADS